ncbi:DHHA1 domain-containing protein [Staphylothermus hellenicus]|uniref:Phosphoesterase DHHA1 n=1 Tax=Staphylothermus hellenicus (strain DSM 12710 / JCM 10830 / BK20S6-10-b1 / P8) TaxID=591019 RepID=D7D9F7_STAHD|nr:phosphoesterase DHHA1 [Staphylothermus hellenicus DSM 12710]
MSRWVVLVHGDSDGVCSGALIYRYLSSKNNVVEVFFTHPAGLASDLAEFTRNGDNMFIADIALSEQHLYDIEKILRERSRYGEIIYVDHHPEPLRLKPYELPGIIIHDICCSASELTYRFLEEKGLAQEYSRVALYGAIGDYLDETSWVKKTINEWDKRSIYFEAGVLVQGLEGSRKMYDFKRRIVRLLADNRLPSENSELLLRALIQSHNDEELRIWVRRNVCIKGKVSYVADPPGSIGRAANYARVYGGSRVGLAYETRGNMLIMSLRAINGIDLNTILRKITVSLGGTGGGHAFAAGARISSDKFNEFLELLNKNIDKNNDSGKT